MTTLPLVFDAPRRGKPPRHLADLTPAERKARLEELGLPGFRARQLSAHYFSRLVDDPEQMTDLPASQRAELVESLLPHLMTPLRTLEADKGTTRKTLWRLFDGALVESVLMRYPGRVTMCVSSQAGCGMACPFCATGQGGLQRNMSTAEIVEQVVAGARSLARDEVPGGPGRVSNVVFMGMGEPMANYKAVIGAVRRLTDPTPDGLGMSARGITVSTVGLVPGIDRLAGEGLPVTLALSLHAPDDALRDELVPLNSRYQVAEVLDASRRYFEVTGRRVSIEYALIRDVNDHAWRADLLADELGNQLAQPRGQRGAAPVDADDGELLRGVLLGDLVRDPHERAPHVVAVEDDLLGFQPEPSWPHGTGLKDGAERTSREGGSGARRDRRAGRRELRLLSGAFGTQRHLGGRSR